MGTNLIAQLVKQDGCKIRVVDNLSVGTRDDLRAICNFVEMGESVSDKHKVELWAGDIKDPDFALKATHGMECIVHLAANTGVIPSIENPQANCEVNVIGTFNYLEAAKRNSAKKFIFASSGAPLGAQLPPINEEKIPKPIFLIRSK
ncbi:MAG: GDP-mannose 4,6-dehydratase [Desulfobulbaceae bacterium]|nr:GDP-mannose 4,6-dehydratase [Desulfobulbaceae bacterium]